MEVQETHLPLVHLKELMVEMVFTLMVLVVAVEQEVVLEQVEHLVLMALVDQV
jgi:hypothetical protein